MSVNPFAHAQFSPRALYIHIPFCAGHCAYCDFFSIHSTAFPHAKYIYALIEQLRAWSSACGAESFDTIYIGGGTPSVLEISSLEQLLSEISLYATKNCEWTIEANPESLTTQFLDALAVSGVTRISLGIQTLAEDEWAVLGRVGSVHESLRALERARAYPFDLSADLLVGIPILAKNHVRSQNLVQSIAELSSHVSHLSLYDLTLEPGTALERRVNARELSLMAPDEMMELRLAADAALTSSGFYRYEVSNYARQGHECKHNIAYWNMEPYLGIGSGAVSTLHMRDEAAPEKLGALIRLTGVKDVARYTREPTAIPEELEKIDRDTALFEFLMMGFRTMRGVDTQKIYSLFGVELSSVLPRTLTRWKDELIWRKAMVSLHPRNFDILNRFLVECMEELL